MQGVGCARRLGLAAPLAMGWRRCSLGRGASVAWLLAADGAMPYCSDNYLWASTHGEEVAVADLGSRLDPPSARQPGRSEVRGEAALCTLSAFGWSVRVVRA
jgi:hypothetical protein